MKPADGDWERLAKRLAHALEEAMIIVEAHILLGYPDAEDFENALPTYKEFMIEAEAALKDD